LSAWCFLSSSISYSRMAVKNKQWSIALFKEDDSHGVSYDPRCMSFLCVSGVSYKDRLASPAMVSDQLYSGACLYGMSLSWCLQRLLYASRAKESNLVICQELFDKYFGKKG
jgi:hypothetical protein